MFTVAVGGAESGRLSAELRARSLVGHSRLRLPRCRDWRPTVIVGE